MKLVVTYCSGPKRHDPGGLPAVKRYLSERINALAAVAGPDLRILSGEFALLEPDEYIPWYDHLLTADEVHEMSVTVADQLVEWEPELVEYHTADPESVTQVRPYLEVMERACRFAGIPLEVVLLPGNPD
jgi:hypothetical protein